LRHSLLHSSSALYSGFGVSFFFFLGVYTSIFLYFSTSTLGSSTSASSSTDYRTCLLFCFGSHFLRPPFFPLASVFFDDFFFFIFYFEITRLLFFVLFLAIFFFPRRNSTTLSLLHPFFSVFFFSVSPYKGAFLTVNLTGIDPCSLVFPFFFFFFSGPGEESLNFFAFPPSLPVTYNFFSPPNPTSVSLYFVDVPPSSPRPSYPSLPSWCRPSKALPLSPFPVFICFGWFFLFPRPEHCFPSNATISFFRLSPRPSLLPWVPTI